MSAPQRDLQPCWQTRPFGSQSDLSATMSYEQPNMDNSETYVSQIGREGLKGCSVSRMYANQFQRSSSNGPTSMLQLAAGDSGFYDSTLFGMDSNSTSETHTHRRLQHPHRQKVAPLASSFGSSPIMMQGNGSDLLAKWDKWLHDWYINSGRKMPNENQLLFLCASISAPMHAVQARFQQYYELDNNSTDSLLYSSSSSQEPMVPPETSGSMVLAFADPPAASLEMSTCLVELTADEQTSRTSLTGSPELSVETQNSLHSLDASQRPLEVGAHTISGAITPAIAQNPRSDRVILTASLISLISELVTCKKSTGCGVRASR
jgi:hypothetical protein